MSTRKVCVRTEEVKDFKIVCTCWRKVRCFSLVRIRRSSAAGITHRTGHPREIHTETTFGRAHRVGSPWWVCCAIEANMLAYFVQYLCRINEQMHFLSLLHVSSTLIMGIVMPACLHIHCHIYSAFANKCIFLRWLHAFSTRIIEIVIPSMTACFAYSVPYLFEQMHFFMLIVYF